MIGARDAFDAATRRGLSTNGGEFEGRCTPSAPTASAMFAWRY